MVVLDDKEHNFVFEMLIKDGITSTKNYFQPVVNNVYLR